MVSGNFNLRQDTGADGKEKIRCNDNPILVINSQ